MAGFEGAVVDVSGLRVCRGSQIVLEDISFQVEVGSNTAIVGPNGAGKSTLVQAILGILPHQAGAVRILGHPLSPRGHLPQPIRQSIAYLPQSFLFDQGIPMTVGEFVSLGWGSLRPSWPWQERSTRQRAVCQALERVDALHLRSQSLSRLSGGETKRVLLAYCLVWPRQLLILDEAPSGLDVRSEGEFYRLLAELQHGCGWAIVQVSHDLERVSRHCTHAICLNRTILCQGSPDHTLTPDHLALAYGRRYPAPE